MFEEMPPPPSAELPETETEGRDAARMWRRGRKRVGGAERRYRKIQTSGVGGGGATESESESAAASLDWFVCCVTVFKVWCVSCCVVM